MNKDELERYVDAIGMRQVLQQLAEISYEKADHLSTNWQDAIGERLWTRAGNRIDKLASTLNSGL